MYQRCLNCYQGPQLTSKNSKIQKVNNANVFCVFLFVIYKYMCICENIIYNRRYDVIFESWLSAIIFFFGQLYMSELHCNSTLNNFVHNSLLDPDYSKFIADNFDSFNYFV